MDAVPVMDAVQFNEILCALDLGPHSATTLAWAGRFACDHHARLRIVHTIGAPEPKFAMPLGENWRDEVTKVARAELHRLQEEVGMKTTVYLEDGSIPNEVCSLADALHADLLVIGRTARRGSLGRLRLHSYAIIRQSPCPVASV